MNDNHWEYKGKIYSNKKDMKDELGITSRKWFTLFKNGEIKRVDNIIRVRTYEDICKNKQ